MKIVQVTYDDFVKEFPQVEKTNDDVNYYYSEEKKLGVIRDNNTYQLEVYKKEKKASYNDKDDFDFLIALSADETQANNVYRSKKEIEHLKRESEYDIEQLYSTTTKSMKKNYVRHILVVGIILLLLCLGIYVVTNIKLFKYL